MLIKIIRFGGYFMEAIILAAGYGTRLWETHPEAKNKPKGLFKYNGRPVIDYVVEGLLKVPEISRIILVTNDRFFMQFNAWRSNYDAKGEKGIYVLNDKSTGPENRLGSIGDLKHAIEQMRVDDDVLVVASDYAFLFDFKQLYDFYQKIGKSITLTTTMTEQEISGKHGNILVDGDWRVTRFVEKPEQAFSPLSSVACYVVSKSDFKYLGECIAEKKDATGYLFEKLLEKSELYAFNVPREEVVSIDQLIK